MICGLYDLIMLCYNDPPTFTSRLGNRGIRAILPTHHIQHHTVCGDCRQEEMSLNGSPVLGVLSDISGVLSESSAQGDGVAIPGSPEAILRYENTQS